MYKLRAGHFEFLTSCIEWANNEAERYFALGYVVSIQAWGR